MLLSTEFANGVLKFEASLIAHLNEHDKILKERIFRYAINLGQDPKKPTEKKNFFVVLFKSIKTKVVDPVVNFFQNMFG